LLLPLLVLAALPRGWASVRAARVGYLSMIAGSASAGAGVKARPYVEPESDWLVSAVSELFSDIDV
jgi:hypothetical protein